MMLIETERDHLLRDPTSKALINKNTDLYRKRLAQRHNEVRIKNLEYSLQAVTDELKEIRNLLAEIVHRK